MVGPSDRSHAIHRILFASFDCYLDDSNGAAIASRAIMEALACQGFDVEVLTGSRLDAGDQGDLGFRRLDGGWSSHTIREESWSIDTCGVRSGVPPHNRGSHRGVPITLYRDTSSRLGNDEYGREEFRQLLSVVLRRFRPHVVVNYGGDRLAHEIRSLARANGAVVVFPLHNFNYFDLQPFSTADAVIVPSRFAADHYRTTLGLACTVIPNLVATERVLAEIRDPRYVTFVNRSAEKGVHAFARIADELGRRRPEIPLLVVESRGSERTLADCGLDLRCHGNVFLMAHTPDPRHCWSVTALCLMPSLWWESQPLVAVEAMINGIPVIASDRGGLPETLGHSGVLLPLTERLTPRDPELPTPVEIAPWIESIIRAWDDAAWREELSRGALVEARRWAPEALASRYAEFFERVISSEGRLSN